MRGRKPTPTALKLARGNPGRRPINAGVELDPPAKLPKPPGHLDAHARKTWRSLGKMLLDAGIFAETDCLGLAMICQLWSRCVHAEKRLAEHGVAGNQINPERTVLNQSFKLLTPLLAEFGMSPAGCSRIPAQLKAGESDLAKMFFGGSSGNAGTY